MTSAIQAADKKEEAVILLHGLARKKKSMSRLAAFLDKKGYRVINTGYPSRKHSIEYLSQTVMTRALSLCREKEVRTIHLVTHSLGGILVRHYLARHRPSNLGRVVMLSPPNHGSQVVDKLKNLAPFKWLNGPAGQQLGTAPHSIPNQLGPVNFEAGIITGDRSINLFLSLMIPGKNDGKVSVDSARVEGMKDFLVVHRSHPFIMNDPGVHHQVFSFLMTGRFDHDQA